MSFLNEARRGVLEGVKQIPSALRSAPEMSPVSKYALHSNLFSPNRSAQKWLNKTKRNFRRGAANEVRGKLNTIRKSLSFNNTPQNNRPRRLRQPRQSPLTQTPRVIPRPSPYLYATPLTYTTIKTPITEQELRGGRRKTRRILRR